MFQVAVPLSPSSSSVDQRSEGALSSNCFKTSKFSNRNIQTTSVIDLGISDDYLPRRSFSEDDIDMHHVIIDVQEGSNDNHLEKLSFKLSGVSKKKLQKINTIIWYRDFNATSQLLKKLSNEFIHGATNKKKSCYPLERKVYRFDSQSISFSPFKVQDDNARIDVIKSLLQGVNLKSHDFLNRPVQRDQILMNLTNKLKNVNFNERRNSVRANIVEILYDLPISFFGTTRRTYLNRLANMLLNRLQSINFGIGNGNINRYKYVNLSQSGMRILTSGIQPTEDELKVLVREELMDYVGRNQLKYNLDRIKDIEAYIIDILLDLMDDIRSDRDGNAKEKIIKVLRKTSMFTSQPEELAKRILEQLKEMFNVVDESHITEKPQLKSESIIMYQNECNACKEATLDNESQTSYEDNLKFYTLRISHIIDEWLSDLGCHKLKFCDKFSRQAIIDDLAEDVVDRFKYLELNPPKHYFYDDLEHLKYQIFKWMSKLTGEENLVSLETAPELMRRLKQIPLPFLNSVDIPDLKGAHQNQQEKTGTDSLLRLNSDRTSSMESFTQTYHQKFSTPESSTDKPVIMNTPKRISQLSMFAPKLGTSLNDIITKEPVLNETMNYENSARFSSIYLSLKEQDNLQVPNALSSGPSASPSNLLTPSKSIKELNEEYDNFVKNWTYEIPIPSSTPEDQNVAKDLRLGIYNGVWKSVAKLKNHPSNIFNPFHYQDLLDDELEDIFKLLPQTEELQAKKHHLKVQFIEKTVNINDQLKMSFAPDIFKQDVFRNILTHVPRTKTNTADEDPVKLYEELEILQLAEIYILYTRFKDEDQLKANVFRTKLVKRLQEVVDELKTIHQQELEHIDRDLYMNDLLSAMQQVPLPSDNTIKAEADEILIGMEIEQWMGDLPLANIENTRELFTRRRLKDNLAKKVYDLEKSVNISDSDNDRLLKMEISVFLDKLPLHRDQSLNLNFMVDELTNRIKNMGKGGKSSVNDMALDTSGGTSYADFSRQVPKASSYNLMPVSKNMSGHQSINALKSTPSSGIKSSMTTVSHVPIPTQSSNEVTQQPTVSGINSQPSLGQPPSHLWNPEASVAAASELRVIQPLENISNAVGSQWQSTQSVPMLPRSVTGFNDSEAFRPPLSSTIRPQEVQTISECKSMDTTAMESVKYFQPIPFQQQHPNSAITDSSVCCSQRLAGPVQNPPLYTSFEQYKPPGSSFYSGHEINKPKGFHESGSCTYIGASQSNSSESQPVTGHPKSVSQANKVNQLNQVSADSTSYHTIPMDSQQLQWPSSVNNTELPNFAGQSRQAAKPIIGNHSCQQGCPNQVLPRSSESRSQLGPKFYRSTDPQGIKQFTEQNMKNRPQDYSQHHISQNIRSLSKYAVSQDCCPQISSGNYGQISTTRMQRPQTSPASYGQVSASPAQHVSSFRGLVSSSTPNVNNVQASPEFKQDSASRCPGKSCPVLKRAMESQCPEKDCLCDSDNWDPEELNVRCRCLERFKKSRMRRLGYENPMYRFFSPCFCFPDMV